VWLALSKRFQSEEEPWKIVALWDGFAQEEERRCSKIVMSMNGQLAYLGMSFTAFDAFAFAGHSNHSKQVRFASFSSG
jgi:hypothetical protein